MKLICVPLFIAACFLLYYGSGMLLLVPGYRGESYWTGRVVYGLLPIVGSLALLVTIGWLWARSSVSLRVSQAIGRTFVFALGAILLFWIGLIIVADIQQR